MYTADNMIRFLGPTGTDAEAQQMAEYLEKHGWTLTLLDDEYYASLDNRDMEEREWLEALQNCFAENQAS